MQTIIGIIFAGIVAFHMIPAVLSHDTDTIQRAADKTIEQIINFGTDQIINEVEGLPFKVLQDTLLENK